VVSVRQSGGGVPTAVIRLVALAAVFMLVLALVMDQLLVVVLVLLMLTCRLMTVVASVQFWTLVVVGIPLSYLVSLMKMMMNGHSRGHGGVRIGDTDDCIMIE
jgi:hypothetical protein